MTKPEEGDHTPNAGGFHLVLPGASSTLYFTAGIDGEAHGLFGTLTVNPASLPPPENAAMVDPNLQVSTVISRLDQPTSMAFLGPNDFFVLEKASGKVKHVVNGAAQTVLTLPVNSASERGLLGIALQPDFANTHGVYLYWTQSLSGTVSSDIADVPLLGNRVDRYLWNANARLPVQRRRLDVRGEPAGWHDGRAQRIMGWAQGAVSVRMEPA